MGGFHGQASGIMIYGENHKGQGLGPVKDALVENTRANHARVSGDLPTFSSWATYDSSFSVT